MIISVVLRSEWDMRLYQGVTEVEWGLKSPIAFNLVIRFERYTAEEWINGAMWVFWVLAADQRLGVEVCGCDV